MKFFTFILVFIFQSWHVYAEADSSPLIEQNSKLIEKIIRSDDNVEIITVEKENLDPIEYIQQFFELESELSNIPEQLNLKSVKDSEQIMENYKALLDIFSRYTVISKEIGKIISQKIDNEEVLTGNDLYFLKKTITLFYHLSNRMLDYGSFHLDKNIDLPKELASKNLKNNKLIDHQIFMSSNLLILEHFLEIYPIFYGKGELRRIVKNIFKDKESKLTKDKTFEDLIDLIKEVVENVKKKKFKKQLYFVVFNYSEFSELLANNQDALTLLELIVSNKHAYEIIDGTLSIPNKRYSFVDSFLEFTSFVTDSLSKFFGNLSGSIKWRDGYLFKNEMAHNKLKETLKPLDILLEKTPFALTDKFIPGHYGHAALYLGTKEQLEELGVWDHPSLEPYKTDIENGKVILEAVRPGVRLTSIEEFMQIDEISILRKSDILTNKNDIYEAITRGMIQIAKAYDFNFDVETLDKIVCSELIYLVYGNVIWPTKYRFKRNTITPDNVAEIQFFLNSKFNMPLHFYSEKNQTLINQTKFDLAPKLGFEPDGLDENNNEIFAKKSVKCYNLKEVAENNTDKLCHVVKKRYVYQEGSYGTHY